VSVTSDRLKSEFTGDLLIAHGVVKELLWLLYPQDRELDSDPSSDAKADECAAYIIDGLKLKNLIVPYTERKKEQSK
jgi:hypothetical protein